MQAAARLRAASSACRAARRRCDVVARNLGLRRLRLEQRGLRVQLYLDHHAHRALAAAQGQHIRVDIAAARASRTRARLDCEWAADVLALACCVV